MQISQKLKNKIDSLPQNPGVYIYKDAKDEVLYAGKSVRLKDRVKSYFVSTESLLPKTKRLVTLIRDIEYIETESEIEALLLEARLIKKYQPFYNFMGKDDKRSKYIKIGNAAYRRRNGIRNTLEKKLWPNISSTRIIDDNDAIYFGPFPEGRTVSEVMRTLRKTFPWCKYQSIGQLEKAKKSCFYSHIKLCPGICDGRIDLRSYWEIFDQLVLFMEGKRKKVQKNLQMKMNTLAKTQEYEQAAFYRDMLANIDYITQKVRRTSEYIKNPNLLADIRSEEILQLQKVLATFFPEITKTPSEKFIIEGYDISNLGSEFTVGSRVVFVGGEPIKGLYRRYRIKKTKTPNDFAALREVISRRLTNDSSRPHLFLIDGGKGQVSTVFDTFAELAESTPMIGLAKKEEILVIPYQGELFEEAFHLIEDEEFTFVEYRTHKVSPLRKLLQRVRDESHRFAKSYHTKLRRKNYI